MFNYKKNRELDVKGTKHPTGRRSRRKTKKGDPQEKRGGSERKLSYQKTVRQKQFQNWYYPFVIIKNLLQVSRFEVSFLLFVLLLILISQYNSVIKTNMVSTRKKRQSNKRLLSQLDDFDQDMIIGNAVSERLENAVVNEGTGDQDFTVGTSNKDSVVNGSAMTVKTMERCFTERIDREISNIVDTVEDRIQNAILTTIENIVAPKIELAIRSINASCGRDATSVSANSERRKRVGVNASLENASRNNDTLDVSNVNDEAPHNIPDEVSELSVPVTHFDRQPHTHHMVTGQTAQTNHFPEFLTGRIVTPRNLPSHQYKYHKTTIYQWLNKRREIKT